MKMFATKIICNLALCSLLVLTIANGGKYQNDLIEENLKGNVKSYTEYTYQNYKAGKTSFQDWDVQLKNTYNKLGNTISRSMATNPLTMPRSVTSKHSIIYDDYGREIAEKDSNGKISERKAYSFNKYGNLIEKQGNNCEIIYNKYGLRDTIYSFGSTGQQTEKTFYHYTQPHDLSESISIEALLHDFGMEYDTNFTFYSHNRKVKEICHSKTWGNSKMLYAYDKFGNMIMETDSNVTRIGGVSAPDIKNRDSKITIFKMRYSDFDSYHNWLKMEMLPSKINSKTNLVTRKIEYYPNN